MAARPATIRPKPLNFPVLDNNPQSNLECTTTVPIFNGDTLARVLRPVISPQRMLGWSLGIVYLWFGALKLAHLSPVLELIRRTSPLLATVPFYNLLALSELVLGAMLLAGVWKRWTAAAAVMHLIGTFSVVFSSPQIAFQARLSHPHHGRRVRGEEPRADRRCGHPLVACGRAWSPSPECGSFVAVNSL